MTIPIILSSLIFTVSLHLIFSGKIHRSIAGIAGALLMVVIGKIMGFYSEKAALNAIDFNTLGLLLGMMILVVMLEPTGFFQYIAVWSAHASRGRLIILFVLLGSITTVLSMFLDNVTTVVLVAPVTVLICEILGDSSLPCLMAEALLWDTGGVATLIGDAPNVLIGSAAGFSFNDFLVYSLPVVDNVPITIALIPVIQGLGASGMDLNPPWWALAFGAGFGGNATIIGSTANIVVVSLTEKTRSPITSTTWNRRGLPDMLVTCVIASVLSIVYYNVF